MPVFQTEYVGAVAFGYAKWLRIEYCAIAHGVPACRTIFKALKV
jgi:hypothetical protein